MNNNKTEKERQELPSLIGTKSEAKRLIKNSQERVKKSPNIASPDRKKKFEKMGNENKSEKKNVSPHLPIIKTPFHILGFNKQKQILIWHKGKILPTPVRQLTKDELKLLVGDLAVPKEEGNEKDNSYTILKNQILEEAYKKGLVDDDEPIKPGIWKFKDEWIIVSGKQAASIKHGNFSFIEVPVINEKTIEFEKNSWIDLDNLKNLFSSATPQISNIFNKVKNLVSQWQWSDESMIEFVAAFIMLQSFQQAMRWRPWIYLLGASHTGKSYFIEHVLERIFGSIVKRLDKSTAYAVAQSIGGSGKIAIFDEFEKSKHLPDILETLKLSNRGGVKTSGTTGDKAKDYSLHHMTWFTSIYLPRTFSSDQAQLNRTIKLDLKKPEGKYVIGLSDQEAQQLLSEIVATMIIQWPTIESLSKQIEHDKEKYIKECSGKIDGRCVENFMYALALLNVIDGKSHSIPRWAVTEIKDDGENILESIILSKIKDISRDILVLDLINIAIEEPSEYLDITALRAKELLRKNGLNVVFKSSSWYLAVRPNEVRESLFKTHGSYKDLDIKAPLERLSGTEKGVKTEWGNQSKLWAMHIPFTHIQSIIGDV